MARTLGFGLVTALLSVVAAAGQEAATSRVEAAKVLAEQQRALKEAIEATRQAEEAVKATADDEAKRAAQLRAEAALQRLKEAQKAAALQAARAQQEAARAAATRAGLGRGGPERDNVDPQDPVERFALLTPGGPLVVQASLTIDGQPFRVAREKLIAEMIVAADKDKDGRTTWSEALASPRFTLGRIPAGNKQVLESFTRTLDKNGNDLVEQDEARQCVAQLIGAPTFALGGGAGQLRVLTAGGVALAGASNQVDLLTLLDTDKDKALSDKELAAAASRLKSRDADDNDVLDPGEITGVPAAGAVRVAVDSRAASPVSGAVLLGPATGQGNVYTQIRERYKNADGKLAAGCFSQFPELFAALDKDGDGEVASSEILGLNEVAPHLELTVDLATEKIGDGLKIKSLAAELHKATEATETKVVELPGVRISLAASIGPPPRQNFDSIGSSLVARLDKDANGYLEASEMPDAGAQQFALYDLNEDGKAYPAEISAGYARQFAPQATQIVANVVNQGNSIFQTLDTSGDGRLSLREMRAAAERIAALDKNQDGVVGGTEIPETISVSFELGIASSQLGRVVSFGPPAAAPPPRPVAGAPEWFTRMDRNGDGDVTLKEFLGDEADFRRLDVNGDGFLDVGEARAAK